MEVLKGSCLCGKVKLEVASKAPWVEITDNLTQFEAGPK